MLSLYISQWVLQSVTKTEKIYHFHDVKFLTALQFCIVIADKKPQTWGYLSHCPGGLQRPVIDDGCFSSFPLVTFLFSFLFRTQSSCMHCSQPLFIMIRIHTLMLGNNEAAVDQIFTSSYYQKNNVPINEIYFSKRPLLRIRFPENCCKLINLIETTTTCTPSSNSPPSPEHPSGFLFPEEYKLINSTVAAASCHLTLLPLQNTGFPFSFPRTLLADRRSFFLSLTWARISSSLLVSLLLCKGNKNCDECNRVVYFNSWCMAISYLKRKTVVACS